MKVAGLKDPIADSIMSEFISYTSTSPFEPSDIQGRHKKGQGLYRV